MQGERDREIKAVEADASCSEWMSEGGVLFFTAIAFDVSLCHLVVVVMIIAALRSQ
jgi:hypothetical protein